MASWKTAMNGGLYFWENHWEMDDCGWLRNPAPRKRPKGWLKGCKTWDVCRLRTAGFRNRHPPIIKIEASFRKSDHHSICRTPINCIASFVKGTFVGFWLNMECHTFFLWSISSWNLKIDTILSGNQSPNLYLASSSGACIMILVMLSTLQF